MEERTRRDELSIRSARMRWTVRCRISRSLWQYRRALWWTQAEEEANGINAVVCKAAAIARSEANRGEEIALHWRTDIRQTEDSYGFDRYVSDGRNRFGLVVLDQAETKCFDTPCATLHATELERAQERSTKVKKDADPMRYRTRSTAHIVCSVSITQLLVAICHLFLQHRLQREFRWMLIRSRPK